MFISRTSLINISVLRALLWEFPRLIVWRIYNRLASMVYTFVDWQRLADERTKQLLHQYTKSDEIYFYVIVVPQVLHLLFPTIKLVQHNAKIIFILNGISAVEEHCRLSKSDL